MIYYVRYLVQVNKNGKARPCLYIHTSDADKDANQIWYAFGSYTTDPNLPWDSANSTISGSATESWSHEIQRSGGDNTTPMIRATFDRKNMILYLSSGSGTYNPQTHIYENATGLFAFPAQFDCSGYEWTQGQANENYAQLNADADFAVQSQGESGGTSDEIFPKAGPSPVITSATLTAKQAITVVWSADSIVGNQGTSIAPQLTLQYSTDGGNTWTNSGTTISGASGSTVVSNLTKATVYYWRIIANWPTLDVTAYSNEDKWARTVTALNAPSKQSFIVTSLDGVGSVKWPDVDNAASYLLGLVDSESANPSSSSSASSPWSFNEATSGTTVQGKYVKVKAVAAANSIQYENSDWSEAVYIDDNRTPQGEDPITPVEINMTRRIYKAIPYIDVPVAQIGAGDSVQDVITVEYANAHYAAIGDAITPSTLPIAKADELGAIKVGTHLSINAETGVLSVSDNGSIASGNTGLVTGGTVYTETNKYAAFANKSIATSVASGNSNPVTSGAVYTFVTTASNLPKAKKAGGSANAGIVYVNATNGANGLVIDQSNDGLIKVNFATYSAWDSTVETTVANPKYVKQAIEGYISAKAVDSSAGSSDASKLVKLNADGVIDGTMLKVVSVTNYFEAASQNAMLALSSAQDGDICVRTDEHKTYILMSDGAANGYATASNWKELTAPTGTVTSVNGKAGATVTLSLTDIYASGTTKVTIDTSISSTAIGTENYHFPTSKAVQDYVGGKIKAVTDTFGGAQTYSVAGWTAGTTAWDTGGTGLTTATYLKNALTDFKGDLTYSDVGAAASSHTHPISQIEYTVSNDNYTGAIASAIDSVTTDDHDYIPTAKAVYDYKPLITRITATGSTAFGGVTTDLSSYSSSTENYYIPTSKAVQTALSGKAASSHNQAITTIYATGTTAFTGTVTAFGSYTASSEDYKVATAYAIKQALDGKAASSHNQAITTIYATGTTAFAGTVTAFSSYTANSEDYKVATAYAIKTALAGKANSSHTHTSAQISDAISTVADPEASSSFNKVVKTGSDWGQISATLIPVDEDSIIVTSGIITVSDTYLNQHGDNRYLKTADAQTGYVKMANTEATAWTVGAAYSVGDLVYTSGGMLWRCIQQNTASANNSPGTYDSGNNYVYWVPVKIEFSDRYDGTITGNGSTTEFTITHNLGVKDVDVVLIDNTNDQEVFAAVTMYSATQVKIGFGAAPASGKVYRVIVRK